MPERNRIQWLPIIAGWAIAGAALSGLLFLEVYFPLDAEGLARFPSYILYTQFSRAALWVPLTPVVFELRRRIPLRGWRLPGGLLLHAAFALLFMAWVTMMRSWWLNLYRGYDDLYFFSFQGAVVEVFAPRTLFDLAFYAALLGIGALLDANRRNRERAVNEVQLEGRIVEAQLGALRQQMHPHFLHNALNAIAELVRNGENPAAIDAIVKLSALQRTLMTTNTDREVRLGDELEFVTKYLELERLRFGERLRVSLEVAPGLQHAMVPALVLQPLVENASKHGVARRIAPSLIHVQASATAGTLELVVRNDLPEDAEQADDAEKRSGIGLANLKQRLSRLYPGHNSLVLTVDATGARVVIEIPLRLAPPP